MTRTRRRPTNREIADVLREIGGLTALEEGAASFRVRAYENAVRTAEAYPRTLADLDAGELAALRGIGTSIAAKIREYVERGEVAKLEELRARHPPQLLELERVPGLGPKKVERLYEELGIRTFDDLRAALERHEIQELEGFGERTERNIAHGLELVGTTHKERRIPIAEVLPVAERIVGWLRTLPDVSVAEACGSLRRCREMIGDLDIVVATDDAGSVMAAFVTGPEVAEVVSHGAARSTIRTVEGMQVDVRCVTAEQVGAALLYFTGSKEHNIRLRELALQRGMTLNEYGLARLDDDHVVASRTEEEILAALGLPYIVPPMREDTGEIDAGLAGSLPDVVGVDDLHGDLRVMVDPTSPQGADALVGSAIRRGWDRLAMFAPVRNGEDLTVWRERITDLQDRHPQFDLQLGAVVTVDGTGELSLPRSVREQLDRCIATIDDRSDGDRTWLLLGVMDDPTIHGIAAITGRIIGRRPAAPLDVERVLEAAASSRTVIEIDGDPERLDAPSDVVRSGADLGADFALVSSARDPGELDRMRYAVLTAQRGWLPRERVVNARPRGHAR